jgi:hypothetical protein
MRWTGIGDGEGEGDGEGDGASGLGLGDGEVTAACCGPAHDHSVARQTMTSAVDRLIAVTVCLISQGSPHKDSNVLYRRGIVIGIGGTTIFALSGDVNFTHTVTVNILQGSPA